jgi:hypothetical protein
MSLADALATIAALFVPRGRVTIDVSPLTAGPGAELTGHVTYAALEQPRLLRALKVHLQLTSTVLRVGTSADGHTSMQPHTETRDLLEPLVLCTDLPVPAGRSWTAPYSVRLPQAALPPSMPGQLDYHVVARAAVDGETVGAWAHASVLVTGAAGAPSVLSGLAPGLSPGSTCAAPAADGTMQPAMVVEVRGAVTLVQWLDGKPAVWVRSDAVKPA